MQENMCKMPLEINVCTLLCNDQENAQYIYITQKWTVATHNDKLYTTEFH